MEKYSENISPPKVISVIFEIVVWVQNWVLVCFWYETEVTLQSKSILQLVVESSDSPLFGSGIPQN